MRVYLQREVRKQRQTTELSRKGGAKIGLLLFQRILQVQFFACLFLHKLIIFPEEINKVSACRETSAMGQLKGVINYNFENSIDLDCVYLYLIFPTRKEVHRLLSG